MCLLLELLAVVIVDIPGDIIARLAVRRNTAMLLDSLRSGIVSSQRFHRIAGELAQQVQAELEAVPALLMADFVRWRLGLGTGSPPLHRTCPAETTDQNTRD